MPSIMGNAENGWNANDKTDVCNKVPSLVSSFIDTFVDFAVGGQFLPKGAVAEKLNDNFPDEKNLVTKLPAVDRLIAIGDVHGDLEKTRVALKLANVMDDRDQWIGGDTVVVQVGDLLDRGGQELKVIYLLERLKGQAQRQGGDIHIMNGNHEIMNMEGDFRFATKEGIEEFKNWGRWYHLGRMMKEQCKELGKQPDVFAKIPAKFAGGVRARIAALRPGGPVSTRFFAEHSTVLVVGSTVFAHGGLLPAHVDYGLDQINADVRSWMLGHHGRWAPPYVRGRDAVVWLRQYSWPAEHLCNCDLLDRTLGAIMEADRMVVGHTIQVPWGINSACDNKVVRVDVGMSEGCGNAAPEVLEILNDKEIRVITSHDLPKSLDQKSTQRHSKVGLASLL